MSFFRYQISVLSAVVALSFSSLALASAGDNQIRALEKSESDASTSIRIVGTKRPRFTVYRLENPPRVVVEISSAELGPMLRNPGGKVSLATNSWSVSRVSAHELRTSAGNIVRVMVGMAREGRYQVRAEGDNVVVRVKAEEPKKASNATLVAREHARDSRTAAKAAQARATKAAAELAKTKKNSEAQIARAENEAMKARKAAELARAKALKIERRTDGRLSKAKAKLQEAERVKAEALAAQRRAEKQARAAKARAEKALAEAKALRRRSSEKSDATDFERRSKLKQMKAASRLAEQRRVEAYERALAADKRREQALSIVKEQKQKRRLAEERRIAAETLSTKQQAELLALSKERDALKAEVAKAKKLRRSSAKTRTVVKASPRTRVRDLQVIDSLNGGRIVISTAGKADARVIASKGRKAVLEIPNAGLPAKLARVLDAKGSRGVLAAVSTFNVPNRPGVVRVVVDLKRRTKSFLRRSGDKLYWDFGSTMASKLRGEKPVRSRAMSPTSIAGYGATSTPITQQTISQFQGQSKVYKGRKIDLEYKDADIHNLLRLLADVGAVNMVIPDDVKAKVTVRLKNVPWDQALEVILSSKKLWYTREGNLVRIDQREVLDKEAEDDAKRREAARRQESPEAEIFPLNYASASDLSGKLAGMLSPKGQLQVDDRSNSVIVSDISGNRKRIIELMRRLDTQTPQIQIEARVVEARTTYNRDFGIQWGGNVSATQATGNSTGLVFPANVALAGAADDAAGSTTGLAAAPSNFAVNMPAGIGSGVGGGLGLALGSVGGNVNVNLRLSALETTGVIRIVSQPKIITSNNVAASIKSGVSIPVSVVSAGGAQTQFVPADLALDVTPKVSQRDCTVELVLKLTKNEPDFGNTGARGDPSIITQEATTTLLVADGETAVVGGIYTRNSGRNYSKVPFFAEIPLLGYLFKTRSESDTRNETLLFVTPKVVNRAALTCE